MTDGKGLSSEEAEKRLQEYGPNELESGEETSPLDVLLDQFKENILIWILMFAAVASFVAGEWAEFVFVVTIIVIVAIMGFFQEWKAEKAMQELQKMAAPSVNVYRDGKIREMPSEKIVPGDVVKLEMGGKVPADAEVIQSNNLKVDESILTGESEAVTKHDEDEIFSGTVVARGRCEAEVTKTGMETKLGEIAGELQEETIDTPLQRKTKDLARKIGYLAVIVSVILFSVGILAGEDPALITTVTIAVAVAVVPEALPLTMTVTLSLGMKGLAKQNALVKKMLAVEGLGSTTVICTDKTGTLTKNEMTVKRIYAGGEVYKVTGSGYSPDGQILKGNEPVKAERKKSLELLIKTGALCNNAVVRFEGGEEEVYGEPTEASLVTLVEKSGYSSEVLREKYDREEEILFTSERKRMTTIHKDPEREVSTAFMKGAPEIVLERCTHYLENGEIKELTEEKKEEILEKNKTYAQEAMRVLAFAYREDAPVSPESKVVEKDMTFLGLTGIIDPPRKEVPKAIRRCKRAGIQVKMVTGDNENTAKAIAKRIDLTDNLRVITGDEMDQMSVQELSDVIEEVDIYARTHPGNKSQIVKALQNHGEIVAMTGDGVNDAPAVNSADIGIGMGIKGTDVTKEASDMILQDDNFGTIEKAISGGRKIYDNIEKFVTFLLSRNFTEVILIASILAITRNFQLLPLGAMQILFLNMIGQTGPGMGLGVDPPDEGIMERPPRDPNRELLNQRNLFMISAMAITMVSMASLSYYYGLLQNCEDMARTMAFTSIAVMIIVNAYNFRSLEKTIGQFNPFKNKWIILASLITIPFVLFTLYYPPLMNLFGNVRLGIREWMIAGGSGLATLILLEVVKRITNFLDL